MTSDESPDEWMNSEEPIKLARSLATRIAPRRLIEDASQEGLCRLFEMYNRGKFVESNGIPISIWSYNQVFNGIHRLLRQERILRRKPVFSITLRAVDQIAWFSPKDYTVSELMCDLERFELHIHEGTKSNVVKLAYDGLFQGVAMAEIARSAGVPARTMQAAYHRLRYRIMEYLEPGSSVER